MPGRPVLLTFGSLLACLAAGYGVLFTMLDDYRNTYGIGEGALGLVIGIGFLSGFVAQVTLAPIADRGRARLVLFSGMALNVVGLVMMAVATEFIPLLAGRIVMGIGVGMAVPAVRRIVILADPANLGQNLGRLLSIDVAGFAAGPIVSALTVESLGIPAPFLIIAAGTIVITPFAWRQSVVETDPADAPTRRFAFDLLRHRPFAGAVVLGCTGWLMIGVFDALWAVALSDLDGGRWLTSLGISVFALPLIILAATGGRLAQRIGPFRVSTVGLLGGAMFMAMYGWVPSAIAMFVVAMVHAINDGLTMASTGIAVGMVVPPERQAGAQGVLGGMQVLTAGVVATLGGVVYQIWGRQAAYTAAAVAMVALVITGRLLVGAAFGVRGAMMPSDAVAVPALAVERGRAGKL
jgi:MFS family permease